MLRGLNVSRETLRGGRWRVGRVVGPVCDSLDLGALRASARQHARHVAERGCGCRHRLLDHRLLFSTEARLEFVHKLDERIDRTTKPGDCRRLRSLSSREFGYPRLKLLIASQ